MTVKEKTTGDLLKERRERKGLSRLELSVRSGVSTEGIRHIELGMGSARVDTLQKLAKALGCKTKELVP